MKTLEFKACGLEELTFQEAKKTDGGSVLLAVAVAVAIVAACSGCTLVVNTGSGNVNVGDQKEGGTDVNAEVGVNV